jgi:hypothetical protein
MSIEKVWTELLDKEENQEGIMLNKYYHCVHLDL